MASSIGCFGFALDPRVGNLRQSLLQQMSLDIGVAGLPGHQVQVDLQPGLIASGVRDLDDDGSFAVRASLAFDAP